MDINANVTLQASTPTTSSKMLWTGRIISGLIILFMTFDGVTKVMKIAPVVQAMQQGGFAAGLAPIIGVIALLCTLFYAIPRTSALGAILLTAYLGGATVTNLRVGQSVYFSIVFGVLTWLALYCRDARIRALLPLT